MPEYGFSLTCIFPYKDRIVDSVQPGEYMGQRKPAIWHILHSAYWKKYWKNVNPLMPGGNKRTYILKQTCSYYLQVCFKYV